MGTPSSTGPFRRWFAVVSLATASLGLAQIGNLPAGTIQTTAAPVALPSAVAYDAHGNLYIAEAGRHVVRRLDAQGRLTTIAGSGVQGFAGDGGAAVAAAVDSPQGLAVASGLLYVADTHNQRVRRVDLASGVVTTVGGTGVRGFSGDNGSAGEARLNLPTALAVDVQGNLYLADTGNHRVRRVGVDGVITTVAGSGVQGYSGDGGAATQARIDSPSGLAVDARGNLYLADTHNHRVRRIDAATGLIGTVAGTGMVGRTGDNGVATGAALALPRGLAVDADGNVYVSDLANHRIRRVDGVSGVITTLAGSGTEGFSGDAGPAVAAAVDSPRAVAAFAGQVSLADSGNSRVRQVLVPAAGVADFTLAATGATTQTISSGSKATFTFTAQTQAGLSSSIILAVSGLPLGATASFSPAQLPGAGAATDFTLTIATTKGLALNRHERGVPIVLGMVLPLLGWRRRRLISLVCCLLVSGLLFGAEGCGQVVVPGTPRAVISVTGTAIGGGGASIRHSATVTLMQTLP